MRIKRFVNYIDRKQFPTSVSRFVQHWNLEANKIQRQNRKLKTDPRESSVVARYSRGRENERGGYPSVVTQRTYTPSAVPLPYGGSPHVGSGHGRPEGGKVIAGIQRWSGFLSYCWITRWPGLRRHVSLVNSGRSFRNFAGVQTTYRDFAGSCGSRGRDDTGYRGGVSDFRGCG